MARKASIYRKEVLEEKLLRSGDVGSIGNSAPVEWSFITLFIFLFFVAALLFSFTTSLARTESVRGKLRYMDAESRIAPGASGVVESCAVNNGDQVSSGQILIKVRTEQFLTQGTALSQEEIIELQNEINLLQLWSVNADSRAEINRQILEQEITAASQLLASKVKELNLQDRQLGTLRARLESARESQKKGLTTLYETYPLEDSHAALMQSIEINRSEVIRLNHQIGLGRERLSQIGAELEHEKFEAAQQISRLNSQLARQRAISGYSIKAPIDGRVTASLCRVGEAVRPDRTMMVVLPNKSSLIGELSISSNAVAMVRPGQSVRIRYDALKTQQHRTFTAIIREISETTSDGLVSGASGEAYLVLIEIPEAELAVQNGGVALQSGMQFTADIVLEDRRTIDWVLDAFRR